MMNVTCVQTDLDTEALASAAYEDPRHAGETWRFENNDPTTPAPVDSEPEDDVDMLSGSEEDPQAPVPEACATVVDASQEGRGGAGSEASCSDLRAKGVDASSGQSSQEPQPLTGKKRRAKERKQRKRAQQLEADKAKFGGPTKPSTAQRLSQVTRIEIDSTDAFRGIAQSGYVGKVGKGVRGGVGAGEEWVLTRLREEGYRILPWDGK